MRLIREGNPSKIKNEYEVKQVTCRCCGAKLEIQPKDVYFYMTAFFMIKYHFECPRCKEWTKVKLRDMTPNFKYWVQYHNGAF